MKDAAPEKPAADGEKKEATKSPEEVAALLYAGALGLTNRLSPLSRPLSPTRCSCPFRADLLSYLVLVKKTVASKEIRHLQRALRHAFASLRRRWTPALLARLVNEQLPQSPVKQQLVSLLNVPVILFIELSILFLNR